MPERLGSQASRLAALVAALLIAAACTGGGASPTPAASATAGATSTSEASVGPAATPELESELVINATGGAFEAALETWFYRPFEQATGVKITPVAASRSETFAKLEADAALGQQEWDIVTTGITQARGNDLLATLDCGRIPNAEKFGLPGTCRDNVLLRTLGPTIIAYSTEAFPDAGPESWADYFDVERFPGPRGMPNHGAPWEMIAAALLAEGVAPGDLFPFDYERAFAKLDELRPNIKVFWESGDQSQQILRDGEVVMNMMWDGRANALIRTENRPLKIVWHDGLGGPGAGAYWAIVEGAPHPNAAYAFLDFFMGRPEAHLGFSNTIYYDTSNRAYVDLVSEEEKAQRSSAFLDKFIEVGSVDWVIENKDDIVERWNAWLAAG